MSHVTLTASFFFWFYQPSWLYWRFGVFQRNKYAIKQYNYVHGPQELRMWSRYRSLVSLVHGIFFRRPWRISCILDIAMDFLVMLRLISSLLVRLYETRIYANTLQSCSRKQLIWGCWSKRSILLRICGHKRCLWLNSGLFKSFECCSGPSSSRHFRKILGNVYIKLVMSINGPMNACWNATNGILIL